ncbi:hypothetical protein LXL04_011728 [Taraxacum kok-saghyz]
MVMEEESPRSPEAKLGMELEELWDVQEAQLSPTEKLNACFERIPVSEFPHASPSQVIDIKSDASLLRFISIDLVRWMSESYTIMDMECFKKFPMGHWDLHHRRFRLYNMLRMLGSLLTLEHGTGYLTSGNHSDKPAMMKIPIMRFHTFYVNLR